MSRDATFPAAISDRHVLLVCWSNEVSKPMTNVLFCKAPDTTKLGLRCSDSEQVLPAIHRSCCRILQIAKDIARAIPKYLVIRKMMSRSTSDTVFWCEMFGNPMSFCKPAAARQPAQRTQPGKLYLAFASQRPWRLCPNQKELSEYKLDRWMYKCQPARSPFVGLM